MLAALQVSFAIVKPTLLPVGRLITLKWEAKRALRTVKSSIPAYPNTSKVAAITATPTIIQIILQGTYSVKAGT